MKSRHGLTPIEVVIVVIMLAVLVGIGVGLLTPVRDRVRERCHAMLAMARTAGDSLLVYTAKPESKYTTCADRLLTDAPARR